MSLVFLARQPILDIASETIGYEILHRNEGASKARIDDPDRATAQVILDSFLEVELEQVVGPGRLAFFNVTPRFLAGEGFRALPNDRVVLEVRQESLADLELEAHVRGAAEAGYRIALDGFVPDARGRRLLAHATYVKVDVREAAEAELRAVTAAARGAGVEAIALRVETGADAERARAAGFRYFQGFFFCRPEEFSQPSIPVDRTVLLSLVSELQDPGIKIGRVSEIVVRDVVLSYRVLRLVNSSLYGLRRRIESIQHAIALLGLDRVRSLAMLILMARIDDRPHELFRTGLVRARFCELVAAKHAPSRSDTWFSVGLLSVLDALTGRPMRDVLQGLRLASEISSALLERKGAAGAALDAAYLCEQGKFGHQTVIRIGRRVARDSYLAGMQWATEVEAAIDPFAS